jgi:hypothetical protein
MPAPHGIGDRIGRGADVGGPPLLHRLYHLSTDGHFDGVGSFFSRFLSLSSSLFPSLQASLSRSFRAGFSAQVRLVVAHFKILQVSVFFLISVLL